MKATCRTLGVMLLCCMVSTAKTNHSSPEALSSSELVGAALATFNNFAHSGEPSPEKDHGIDVPSKCWAESIAKLKPVKVYVHRINVAVVLRINDRIEEGKYILIPISSYLPQNGVDGFEFTPNPQKDGAYYSGGSVLDFKRKTGE
jgi:hypothetical protein